MRYLPRRQNRSLIILCTFLVFFTGCTKEQNTSAIKPASLNDVAVSTPTILSEIVENAPTGNTTALKIEMNRFGKGAAYIAKVGDQVRVVHNGKPGKRYEAIESHTLRISPDGQRVAYGAKVGNKWVVVADGKEYGPFDDKGSPAFSPDSRHIAYVVQIGASWYMFVDHIKRRLAPSYFNDPVFNRDSSKVLSLENTSEDGLARFVVSDLSFSKITERVIKTNLYKISADKSMIAVVEKVDLKQRVMLFSLMQPEVVTQGKLYDEIGSLNLNLDGSIQTYIAKNGDARYVVLSGKEERIPEGEYQWPPVIRPDNKGVGLFITDKEGAYLHQVFFNDGIKSKRYKEGADLVYSEDGRMNAYVAIKNEKFLIVVNGKEGPVFDRVISPQFSPDGRYLVYRARQDNKRFVVVADTSGAILRRHQEYAQVFETVFTADGKSVAYGVKDGNQIVWKVEKL